MMMRIISRGWILPQTATATTTVPDPFPVTNQNQQKSEFVNIDYELLSQYVVKMPKPQSTATAVKPTKMEQIQQLIDQARQHGTIGQEDLAIPLLEKGV
jgi:hypothetical protein